MEDNEILFVKLKNPLELRRSVLETTKEVIESLQRYEKFREIREEKKVRMSELKDDIREINKLVNKFRMFLPKTNVRFQEIVQNTEIAEKKIPRKIKKVNVIEPVKETSELDKLEVELRDIESKLSHIK